MTEYMGMRWLKCDLHLHTPEDSRHWQDDGLKLGEPRRPKVDGQRDETLIQDKARQFLRRCHEVSLNVIAVTDHNLSSKTDPRDCFVVHLVEQNKSVASQLGVAPLVIFPGFEVDIGYHVLCLFPPAKKQADIEGCNRILTKLGLPENARFVKECPEQLRHNNQRVSLKKLVEIVQGEHNGIVILAHTDQNRGVFQDAANKNDYSNPDLYCVELTQNPPPQKFADILAGRNQDWTRERFHPAWIMSSDAKSLQKEESGRPAPNSIGYRYTWIKMSQPSIESLRQAFLDPESRIRLPDDVLSDVKPCDRQKHARILSVSFSNAKFLEDQSVSFSSNLNCIIGGRGSGKSTIFEGMRLALGKTEDPKADERTKETINRIKKLLTEKPDTQVKVCWRNRDGVNDTLVFSAAGGGRFEVEGREVLDMATYLKGNPVQFFSQQQLNRMTERSGKPLLTLLDDFIREDLDRLEGRERDVRSRINQLFAAQETLGLVKQDIARLHQELSELDRQWNARASLQDESKLHQGAQSAARYVAKVMKSLEEDGERLLQAAADIAEGHSPIGSQAARWPEGAWFSELDNKVLTVKEALQADVAAAVSKYRQTVNSLFGNDPLWPAIKNNLDMADERFIAACGEKGIAPEDVSRIQEINQQRQVKKQEIDGKEKEKARLEEQTRKIGELFSDLHGIWAEIHHCRCGMAQRVNETAKIGARKVIEVQVEYAGDPDEFFGIWNRLYSEDRRKTLGKVWEEVGALLLRYFVDHETRSEAAPSVWYMVQQWLDAPARVPAAVKALLTKLNIGFDDVATHLKATARKSWEAARTTRVSDRVDMVLYRPDGTEAGKISEGSLSDGQRNTAALAMLLAQGDFPLLLDQPEDELDSNFIYRELVPMLRRLKNHRQIILVTHNANIPVNGDAELVYALETREGHGRRLAEGGLDQEMVASAVLEIMEGSEEAFKRRREKYHF